MGKPVRTLHGKFSKLGGQRSVAMAREQEIAGVVEPGGSKRKPCRDEGDASREHAELVAGGTSKALSAASSR
jgi:hypothetical protein